MFHFCHSSPRSAFSTEKTSHRVQFSLAESQNSWSYRTDAFLANTVILLISIILFSMNTYFWGLTIWDLEGISNLDSACPNRMQVLPPPRYHISYKFSQQYIYCIFDMLHNLCFSLQNSVCFINFYFLFIKYSYFYTMGALKFTSQALQPKGLGIWHWLQNPGFRSPLPAPLPQPTGVKFSVPSSMGAWVLEVQGFSWGRIYIYIHIHDIGKITSLWISV